MKLLFLVLIGVMMTATCHANGYPAREILNWLSKGVHEGVNSSGQKCSVEVPYDLGQITAILRTENDDDDALEFNSAIVSKLQHVKQDESSLSMTVTIDFYEAGSSTHETESINIQKAQQKTYVQIIDQDRTLFGKTLSGDCALQ